MFGAAVQLSAITEKIRGADMTCSIHPVVSRQTLTLRRGGRPWLTCGVLGARRSDVEICPRAPGAGRALHTGALGPVPVVPRVTGALALHAGQHRAPGIQRAQIRLVGHAPVVGRAAGAAGGGVRQLVVL